MWWLLFQIMICAHMIWLIRYVSLNISFAIAFGKTYNELYPGTIYSPRFSIDTFNALIASIYLHQCFYILKILAHSVDFNELYRNVTIHCLNICTYDTSIQLYHSVIIHNRAFVTPVCRSLI